MSSIQWQTGEGYALDSAQTTNRPILVDYYNPQSMGCQQMEAVTYSADNVVHYVNTYLIPFRINVKEDLLHENFHYLWTPTVAVLDFVGNEIQRTIGFLEPDDFIAAMHLGIAKVRMDAEQYDTAMIPLKSLLEMFPKSHAVPEAIYFMGVILYKQRNDPAKLKDVYERLLKDYPDSRWTKRASPYRLI